MEAPSQSLTSDQERWAEALALERQHGDRAPIVVAETIGALARKGNIDGIARWKEIASRLDTLRKPPSISS